MVEWQRKKLGGKTIIFLTKVDKRMSMSNFSRLEINVHTCSTWKKTPLKILASCSKTRSKEGQLPEWGISSSTSIRVCQLVSFTE